MPILPLSQRKRHGEKQMATRTKRPTKKTTAKPVGTAGPKTIKKIGQPIERSKTYTTAQLRDALQISRATLWRYFRHLGLEKYVTPLTGNSWQITGENYFSWLEWRRGEASREGAA